MNRSFESTKKITRFEPRLAVLVAAFMSGASQAKAKLEARLRHLAYLIASGMPLNLRFQACRKNTQVSEAGGASIESGSSLRGCSVFGQNNVVASYAPCQVRHTRMRRRQSPSRWVRLVVPAPIHKTPFARVVSARTSQFAYSPRAEVADTPG
jgi:hypothetical protein